MNKILTVLIILFIWSVAVNASQPHYYSFDRALLSEGEITIEVKAGEKGRVLESFSIRKPNGVIRLGADTIKKIINPKLNTIEMALMPYNLEDEVRFFNEVSMSFFGEKICKSKNESESDAWAPESKVVIIFWDKEYKVRIESGQCDG